jgi:hypothetical protein
LSKWIVSASKRNTSLISGAGGIQILLKRRDVSIRPQIYVKTSADYCL